MREFIDFRAFKPCAARTRAPMLGLTLLTRLWLNASSPLQRPTIECFELMRPHFGQLLRLHRPRSDRQLPINASPTRTATKPTGAARRLVGACSRPFRPHSHFGRVPCTFHEFILALSWREGARRKCRGWGSTRTGTATARSRAPSEPAHVVVAWLSCPRYAFVRASDRANAF